MNESVVQNIIDNLISVGIEIDTKSYTQLPVLFSFVVFNCKCVASKAS